MSWPEPRCGEVAHRVGRNSVDGCSGELLVPAFGRKRLMSLRLEKHSCSDSGQWHPEFYGQYSPDLRRGQQVRSACPVRVRCGNGLSLPVLDVRQTIFKGDQTAINDEKLGIRRAVPVLLCLLICWTFVPSLGCRHIGKFNQDDAFEPPHQV